MTCSLAWFEPATSHYGVAADRQFTGSQFEPLFFADKTAQVQAPGKAPLLLAFAGVYPRVRHVQRWIKEHQHDRVLESPDGVERFLLDLHTYASDGPKLEGFEPNTGRSGVHVVAAHATGLYKMESYAAVYHTPAAQCHGYSRVICAGSAVEFVAGLVHGRMVPDLASQDVAKVLIAKASVYLPQSIDCQTDSLSYAP
jgi:hypothetical protein